MAIAAIVAAHLLLLTKPTTSVCLILILLAGLIFAVAGEKAGALLTGLFFAFPFATYDVSGLSIPQPCVWLLWGILRFGGLKLQNAPRNQNHVNPRWWATVLVLCLGSSVGFVDTVGDFGAADYTEYLKWIFLVLWGALSPYLVGLDKVRLLRSTAIGVSVGITISLFAAASGVVQVWLWRLLAYFGYQIQGTENRFFVLGSRTVASRLVGTYTDPNILALFAIIGIGAAFTLRHRRGLFVWAIVAAAAGIVLSLSRGAILGASISVLAIILLSGQRFRVALIALSSAVTLLSLPTVRYRLLSTSSEGDLGSTDRLVALRSFGAVMSEHWLQGQGWGRPEFRDSYVAFKSNLVANSLLATVYRGGIVAGVCFLIMYLVLLVRALSSIRDVQLQVMCAAVIALIVQSHVGYSLGLKGQCTFLLVFLGSVLFIEPKRPAHLKNRDLAARILPSKQPQESDHLVH